VTGPWCPCGGGSLATCCGPILDGRLAAATAEQLMRSRYTAFALGHDAHLRRSWHPGTCPTQVTVGRYSWTGLEIVATTGGTMLDNAGTVTFRASYLDEGRRGVLGECSRFVRSGRRWVYLDGEPC
jgi:SEC-C motif-containing protein